MPNQAQNILYNLTFSLNRAKLPSFAFRLKIQTDPLKEDTVSQFPRIHMTDFEASPKLDKFLCWSHSLEVIPVTSKLLRELFSFRWLMSGSYIQTWTGEVKLNKNMTILSFGHGLSFAFYASFTDLLHIWKADSGGKNYAYLPCRATVADHDVMVVTHSGKELYCQKGHYFISVPDMYGFDGWVVSPEVFSSHYHWQLT